MAVVFRRKSFFKTLRHSRVSIFVLFAMSSMGMLSFHMVGRTYVPRGRGSVANKRATDTRLTERRRSYEEHTRVTGPKVARANEQETSLLSKRPTLKELKSIRMTLDKAITILEEIGKKNGEKRQLNSNANGESRIFQSSTKHLELDPANDDEQMQSDALAPFSQSKDPNYSGRWVRRLPPIDRKVLVSTFEAEMNITRLKPFEDMPVHELSAKDPYKSRRQRMEKACRSDPDGNYSSIVDFRRVISDDGHKALMCVIPKAACTTWKSIMNYLMGRSTIEDAFNVKRSRLVIDTGRIKSMKTLSRSQILYRLEAFTKFMVTRHPYHRLVSAFRSKFEHRVPSYVFTSGRIIASQILKEYLNGTQIIFAKKRKSDILNLITNLPAFQELSYKNQLKVIDVTVRGYIGNITFEEFLRYGIVANANKSRHFDVHWRPQHVLCNPCALDFDFVIRFEDIERESNMVLDFLQRNDLERSRIKFPGGNPAAVTDTVTKRFFDRIPSDLKEAVRKVYEKDFEYFNYDPNTL